VCGTPPLVSRSILLGALLRLSDPTGSVVDGLLAGAMRHADIKAVDLSTVDPLADHSLDGPQLTLLGR
jgi:hypothetical protein